MILVAENFLVNRISRVSGSRIGESIGRSRKSWRKEKNENGIII